MSEEDSKRSVRNANIRSISKQYEENYDRIFGKKEFKELQFEIVKTVTNAIK